LQFLGLWPAKLHKLRGNFIAAPSEKRQQRPENCGVTSCPMAEQTAQVAGKPPPNHTAAYFSFPH
jgi:hypothetical protein